jgi:hypothetical protein
VATRGKEKRGEGRRGGVEPEANATSGTNSHLGREGDRLRPRACRGAQHSGGERERRTQTSLVVLRQGTGLELARVSCVPGRSGGEG